jgi:uncharacterized protein (DUF488 family)
VPRTDAPPTVWTIGHSTRPIGDFLAVLAAHQIETLVDVRRFPGSRRLPQFGRDALAAALVTNDVGYRWIEELGGRRRPDPASPNDGWRNDAFRAYADHLSTDEFARGLHELLTLAFASRTVIMCAEVLWWRCHRRLIADVLVSLGWDVLHIRDERTSDAHRLAAPARIVDGRLSYESPDGDVDHSSIGTSP